MRILHTICIALCSLHAIAVSQPTDDNLRLTDMVNPLTGSGGHGHVFVGANVPFGMVQLGPTSLPQQWDWCSGYHESDSTLIGFSHTHLSGTGIGDLFDVTVMPVTGEVTYSRGLPDAASGEYCHIDRSRQVVRPGYYAAPLTRGGVMAELTATRRVGLHRYTFDTAGDAALVFDLENGGGWDRAVDTHIMRLDDRHIAGWRRSRGWAPDQRVFFVAEFDRPMTSFDRTCDGRYARAGFTLDGNRQLLAKVALSPVSIAGAAANMAAETAGLNFDTAAKAAESEWESQLGRVRLTGGSDEARRIFYTAMYHTMMAPALFNDADGRYRGADGEIHDDPGHDTYTVLSLWDTYRAAMPLMTILNPATASDVVNTMLNICDEQGRLPVWHLWGNETNTMVGNPGIPVVADAIVKKLPGVDRDRAFKSIITTVGERGRGCDIRDKYGFIPCDLASEAVACDMEYAIADGAAARAASALGNKEACDSFTRRSHSYRHYFDPETRLIRGLDSKGNRRTPFNPYASEHRADDYCEGNAWQYTWLVPHDLPGLVGCFGSRRATVERLDSLMTAPSVIEGLDTSPDISGMIGQYAHGNEPSHHTLYFYTMLGEPGKAADYIRRVLTTLYSTRPDGLSGNEDAGQMSAWYILSSLGFYEVEPAGGRYWFGTPLFDRVSVDVPGGTFTIIADNNSDKNIHIRRAWLNGQPLRHPFIGHDSIMAGGTLRFEMSDTPALWYDIDPSMSMQPER